MTSTGVSLIAPNKVIFALVVLIFTALGFCAPVGHAGSSGVHKICNQEEQGKALQEFSNEQILFIREDEALAAMYKVLKGIKDPWVRALKKKELLQAYQDAKAGVVHDQNTI